MAKEGKKVYEKIDVDKDIDIWLHYLTFNLHIKLKYIKVLSIFICDINEITT